MSAVPLKIKNKLSFSILQFIQSINKKYSNNVIRLSGWFSW